MVKITPLSLYIINRAKLRRLIIDLSSKALSRILEHVESCVTTIESLNRAAQYPPHEYPGLAAALDWTIKDLLPPDDWDVGDGTKVEKKVLSLSNPDDMRLVLNGMIDHGFFNEPKSLADTAKHLYIDGKEEEKVLEDVWGNWSIRAK
ncbi:hypothetical protein SAMN05421740_106187 [Parapedobacter koreensis]|uniref:Uncharacterized protein n=2 Tax=Parapedobacter koreensis TaxID=332977 RepID=A0A1H7QZD6_9SPHI|nr:hypothetical protein SAMN05421740_106187 [Parapedobacter koreensis]